MSGFDFNCPICGKRNRNLDLDETNGWMECERCGKAMKVRYKWIDKATGLYEMSLAMKLDQALEAV